MLLIFITFSNAVDDEMVEIIKANTNGYTKFLNVQGEGTKEPHLGTHIWPDINNCIMASIENNKKDKIAKEIKKLKQVFPTVGINIFVTQLKEMI